MGLIATRRRLQGLLISVSEELDTPLYYTMPGLSQSLKCPDPPLKSFKGAIINAGYKVSGYHKDPNAIKTDAPSHVVWDIMRAWALEKNTTKRKDPTKGSTAEKILSTERKLKEVDWSIPKSLGANNARWTRTTDNGKKQKKISRFPMNPEKNWGPKRAATGKASSAGGDEATKTNNNKNNKKVKDEEAPKDGDTEMKPAETKQ